MDEQKNEIVEEQSEMAAPSEASAPVQKDAPVVNPRRKQRSKEQLFKENTLPVIILGVALLLIIVFIIGSISRSVYLDNKQKQAALEASQSIAAEEERLAAEANALLAEAEEMAARYDFDGAIAVIDRFSGNLGGYPLLQDAKASYEAAKSTMVLWEDPNQIVNLSFQMLVADSARAFSYNGYATSIKKNFVTTDEFSMILQQLYDNGYILISIDDFVDTVTDDAGNTYYKYKQLYLPEGKKPLILTQTNVNYNLYLVDSDGDMIADKNGAGFASRMVLDDDGSVTCEMVDAEGNIMVGAYDLVPILDDFVEDHPDFSYRGAKAVLALTGYNGLFGYRTHAAGRALLGEAQYEEDVQTVTQIAEALRESGYDLACYTYENMAYGSMSVTQIQGDLSGWNSEVVPILGNIDILVFAQLSDITSNIVYTGDKYNQLKSSGFNYYFGFCENGKPFTFIADDYVRQSRILVTGSNMQYHPDWFVSMFDSTDIINQTRDGYVPS